MNWDALGAVGEIVSALAVVGTLIFLALQIRQNTNAVKAQTFTALSDRMSQSNAGPLNEYMARVIRQGRDSYHDLSEENKVSFSYWMLDRLMVYELLVSAPEATSPEIVDGCNRNLKHLFGSNGVREWWELRDREDVSETMTAHVTKLLNHS